MKRVLLAAALCALALSGCDTMKGWFGMPSNDKPVVVIENGRVARVNPDPLEFRREQGTVVITWTLEDAAFAAGFRFAGPGKGVKIDRQEQGPPRDIAVEFSDAAVIARGQKFQLKNRNSGKGTFKYSVTVVAPDGRELPPFDPRIVNIE